MFDLCTVSHLMDVDEPRRIQIRFATVLRQDRFAPSFWESRRYRFVIGGDWIISSSVPWQPWVPAQSAWITLLSCGPPGCQGVCLKRRTAGLCLGAGTPEAMILGRALTSIAREAASICRVSKTHTVSIPIKIALSQQGVLGSAKNARKSGRTRWLKEQPAGPDGRCSLEIQKNNLETGPSTLCRGV